MPSPSSSSRHPIVRPGLLAKVMAVLGVLVLMIVGLAPVAQAADIRDITLPVPHESVDAQNHERYTAEGVYWSDTYGACRSGCSRSHQGVDMLGPKLTPLIAANDGYVSWMRHSATSGNNLVLTDDDGWSYHYIHINNDSPGTDDGANPLEFAFAPGIETGARVTAGQVVAFMGDSGNAESCCSHLHFEITRPDGSNINPTPSVDAALARGPIQQIEVPAEALGPYDSFEALSADLYGTLHGRSATWSENQALADVLVSDGLSAAVEPFVSERGRAAQIDRLYVAFFLRLPDIDGYDYWIDTAGSGSGLEYIAELFAESDEFQIRYANTDFTAFLDQLYEDVLLRSPDEAGKAYWLDLLEQGLVTRGTIVVYFTEGTELRNATSSRSEFIALTALFDDRMPTDQEIATWIALRSSVSLRESVNQQFQLG